MSEAQIRFAGPDDVAAMAAIKNRWIDETPWMPRVHPPLDVERYYRDTVLPHRDVWVRGSPVQGFISLEREGPEVTALFVKDKGRGIGKSLLDFAKERRTALALWSFQANTRARAFYEREGFCECRETAGENEEGLPDVQLRWEKWPIRVADLDDLPNCARIVHNWVERTDWMPKLFSRAEIEGFMRERREQREIYVIGAPVAGYLSLDPTTSTVVALYLDKPGQGKGKALMDRAKEGRDHLQLWTHEPNADAHRFYAREGFTVVERAENGDDGLPELRMEWRR